MLFLPFSMCREAWMLLRSLKNNVKVLLCAAVLFWLQRDLWNEFANLHEINRWEKTLHRQRDCRSMSFFMFWVAQLILANLFEKREKKNTKRYDYETYGVLQKRRDDQVVSLANVSWDTVDLFALKVSWNVLPKLKCTIVSPCQLFKLSLRLCWSRSEMLALPHQMSSYTHCWWTWTKR